MYYTQFEGHTPGPWLWREFGKNWCLCTAHSGALIVLDAFKKGLRVRDIARCLMIDFTPDHPDARLIAAAPDLLADNAQLRAEVEQLRAALGKIKDARDHHDEEGVYPEKIHIQYQGCFDDWAADLAESTLAQSGAPAWEASREARAALGKGAA